jgi:hypothetical protein
LDIPICTGNKLMRTASLFSTFRSSAFYDRFIRIIPYDLDGAVSYRAGASVIAAGFLATSLYRRQTTSKDYSKLTKYSAVPLVSMACASVIAVPTFVVHPILGISVTSYIRHLSNLDYEENMKRNASHDANKDLPQK